MFKKNNYSKRALSTFEIIGACIVDIYYNEFYERAKLYRQSPKYNFDSITEAYKYIVKIYLTSFKNPTDYRKTIIRIHKYYYTTTKFQTISFSDCINNIVKHFLPEDFIDCSDNREKNRVLRTVLSNSIKQFSADILCTNILNDIIDNHSKPDLIRRMQDKMVEALMFEREKMFRSFFEATTKPNKNKDLSIIMKMKEEMIKLVKQNHMIVGKYNKLKDKTLVLLDLVKKKDKHVNLLEDKIKQMLHNNKVQNNIQNDNSRKDIYIPNTPSKVNISDNINTSNRNNLGVTISNNNYDMKQRYNQTPKLVNTQDISSIIVKEDQEIKQYNNDITENNTEDDSENNDENNDENSIEDAKEFQSVDTNIIGLNENEFFMDLN